MNLFKTLFKWDWENDEPCKKIKWEKKSAIKVDFYGLYQIPNRVFPGKENDPKTKKYIRNHIEKLVGTRRLILNLGSFSYSWARYHFIPNLKNPNPKCPLTQEELDWRMSYGEKLVWFLD